MLAPELHLLSRGAKALGCELADRLEHPETLSLAHPDEALVDEGLKPVQVGVADLLSRVEGAAAPEGSEPREEALLLSLEQVVRPLDRRPQRLLPHLRVAAAAKQVKATA